MSNKPNILYIHSHDTGRYIQPYGHAIATPNLQGLAEQGILFRQNFCINPTCSPSRAALLTGCYPHENGMTGLSHRGFSLHDYGQHIVHTLRGAGYTTVLAGTQHVAWNRGPQKAWQITGYDESLEGQGPAEEAAAAFLAAPHSQPFFLDVGFVETHRIYPELADAPDDPRYCMPPSPLPDCPETRQDMTRFKASARRLDHKMGVVFDALERNGLAENTLVICTTDHGIAFPRMKCNLHDSGCGVMLIMRGPGGFTGGKVVDQMTSHLDIFPTVCDLVGVEHPSWLRGKSLLPLTADETTVIHEALFFQVNHHVAYEPTRAVRTERYKYIRRFYDYPHPVLPDCDDGESKSLWMQHGWRQSIVPEEALFDLVFDPNETGNLAGDVEHDQILKDMRRRLDHWMHETKDPLLSGEVSAA